MERRTIGQLAEGALAELARQCYTRMSIQNYDQAFTKVLGYAAKVGERFFSDSFAQRYMLDNYGWDIGCKYTPSAYIRYQLRAIRVLKYYEDNDCIPGRVSYIKKPPDCFRNHHDFYLSECANRGLSVRTVAERSEVLCEFFIYTKEKGFTSIAEINKGLLDEYLSMYGKKAPGSMARVLSCLRCFLRSMFSNSVIQIDLSLFIPSGSKYPRKPVHKLWTGDEVKNLIDFVDRADSKGKRDYALMLLVVRYGIRSGDIINLKLTDINWESMTLQFRQEKTSVTNVLPILDDIGWALADWITNARPKQASTNHVFTILKAPYGGMKDLTGVLKRRMALAGISKAACGRSGPHSLRHSLATNMLAGQVPLPVITAVLGHSSPESTTVYLHSDIEGLRQCALDAEEGGGL
jgi:site-specific recombinase XerD